MIGHRNNQFDEFDEQSTIGSLMPLNVQRRKLLLHPVIDTFVMIKYNSYAVFFITTILMRLLFSLLMTGLTVNYPIETINMNEMNATMNETINAREAALVSVKNNNTAFNGTLRNITRLHLSTTPDTFVHNDSDNFERLNIEDFAEISESAKARPAVFWICFSFLFILTLSLLAGSVWTLVRDLRLRCEGKTKGFFWLLFDIAGVLVYIIALAYLFLLTKDIENPQLSAIVNFVSALLVLLGWINFTASLRFILVGKFYCLGNYISMLTQVAKKVAIFFLLYVAVLVGFTIAFYLTLPEEFNNPFGITKTLAMMTGELEFGDTFGDKDFFRNILFFVFALAVTVVISNLLVGLTVSDVAELLENAKMDGMEFKLEQITQMDNSWIMTWLSWMLAGCTNWSHLISEQDQDDFEVM